MIWTLRIGITIQIQDEDFHLWGLLKVDYLEIIIHGCRGNCKTKRYTDIFHGYPRN